MKNNIITIINRILNIQCASDLIKITKQTIEIIATMIPIISCVGHETDFTITDFTADLRVPTPTAAAQTIVKNQKEIIEQISVTQKRLLQSLEIVYQRLKFKTEKFTHHYIFKNTDLLWQSKAQILDQTCENLLKNFKNKFMFANRQTIAAISKLKGLSPRGILKRGYSIVRHESKIINTAENIKTGDELKIELYKGKLNAEVLKNG